MEVDISTLLTLLVNIFDLHQEIGESLNYTVSLPRSFDSERMENEDVQPAKKNLKLTVPHEHVFHIIEEKADQSLSFYVGKYLIKDLGYLLLLQEAQKDRETIYMMVEYLLLVCVSGSSRGT